MSGKTLSDVELKRLEQLASLKERGVLSEEEFQVQKASLLASPSPSATISTPGKPTQIAAQAVSTTVERDWTLWAILGVIIFGPILLLVIAASGGESTAPEAAMGTQNLSSEIASPNPQPTLANAEGLTDGGFSEPFEGRCHMDTCSWFKAANIRVVQQEQDQKLVKSLIDYGESEHEGGDYPDQYSQALQVSWTGPREVFAFCSPRLPAVIVRAKKGWHVDILDFELLPGAAYGSAAIYVRVCHGPDTAWTDSNFIDRFGYRSPSLTEVALNNPAEMFELARQAN